MGFWELFTSLWQSATDFLNSAVVTIGDVHISLWHMGLGFVLMSMALTFIIEVFHND